jgi:hypothetical protein
MISKSFKKQLIINAYNTQLLLVTLPIKNKVNKVNINHFYTIKRIKNMLFKIEDKSSPIIYKYKYIDIYIDIDISWFLNYLTYPIISIHYYNVNKISEDINNILDKKHDIVDNLDYAKYLEDIYD